VLAGSNAAKEPIGVMAIPGETTSAGLDLFSEQSRAGSENEVKEYRQD
jgi:hypothetical protein